MNIDNNMEIIYFSYQTSSTHTAHLFDITLFFEVQL